jgi:hypothetical protein
VGELVRRHPLIAYFVLAYAGSWLVWGFYVLSLDGVGLLSFHAPASFMVIIALGTFTGPAVAAFVVTALTEGRLGVDRLIARILQWRVGLAWYVFAFLGLPAIETLGTLAMPGVLASFTPVDFWRELAAAAMFFVFPALFARPLRRGDRLARLCTAPFARAVRADAR